VRTATSANLAIERLSAADAERLGRFFEVLAADEDTRRFFHPHPLTKPFAAVLCARQSVCLDRHYITHYHGRIAAYSLLRGWDEGYDVPSFGGCTHPELRGAGLGQLLLAHAIAESRAAGARRLRLTVDKENARAVHLYRKFGFVFSEKNEAEWIGLVELDSAVLCHTRHPDLTKLGAWLREEQDKNQGA
jgi:[ribosomal protein S18]-alanine N-acetyltransferase